MKYLLLVCFPIICTAQYSVKSKIAPATVLFVSGAFDGIGEQVKWHYNDFKTVFPKANDGFWNPEISWTNKYELDNEGNIQGEKFPLSSTVLVFMTDGYHLTRTTSKITGVVGATWLIYKKQKWYYYVFDALIYSVSRGLGFHFTYTVLPNLRK